MNLKKLAIIDNDVETESPKLKVVNCIEEIQNESDSTSAVEDEKPGVVPISNISNLSHPCCASYWKVPL